MHHLDLFAGVGGFALGAEIANIKFNYSLYSEIDPYASAIYKQHFPTAIALGDIKSICGNKLKQRYGANWCITGGFPCQDISCIGKGAGIKEGTRSGLWIEYARLIKELHPRLVIIENVQGLFSKGFEAVLKDLWQCGYDACWRAISAKEIGMCHQRKRVWIVAIPHAISVYCKEFDNVLAQVPDLAKHFKLKWETAGRVPTIDWQATKTNREIYSEPTILRTDDGLSAELHATYISRIKCMGNSVVPYIPAGIFSACSSEGLI